MGNRFHDRHRHIPSSSLKETKSLLQSQPTMSFDDAIPVRSIVGTRQVTFLGKSGSNKL